MEKQTLLFTALPNGRDPVDGALRLSVFVSPRLWNDDASVKKMTLGQFPDLLDWPALISAATWNIAFDGGPTIPATVESAAPRADLWQALFKSETEIKPFQFEDYRGTTIETFPSDKIHDFLTGIYVRAASDPGYGQGKDLPTIETLASDPDLSEIARPSQPEKPVTWTPSREPVDLHGTIPRADPEPGPTPGDGISGGCGCCGCGCLLWPFAILARLFPQLDPIFKRIFGSGSSSGPSAPAEPPNLPTAPFPTPPPPAPPIPPPAERPAAGMPPWPLPLTANRQAFTKLSEFVRPWTEASAGLPSAADLQDKYDFHQMIAALGDFPLLLRLLGIVVDLRVDISGGAPPNSGTVKVSPGIALNPAGKVVTSRTHYEITPDSFGAQPRPLDPEISQGFLRLDDASRFRVMQVDAVGGGIKAQNTATNLAAFATKKLRAPNMPDDGGLPALRTAGISVVRRNLLEELGTAFNRSHALHLAVMAIDLSPTPPINPAAGPPLAPTDELFAEDLVRGYRVDVFDDQSKTWHSLCQRVGTYDFLEAPGGKISLELKDEGFVQFAATEPTKPPANPLLRASDSLFVWDGWSLCAPRPGKAIMPDDEDAVPDAEGNIPVKLDRPKNTAATSFKLETNFTARLGSLPRLRFDYKYRLRARVCDLAGNSVVNPGDPAAPDPEFIKDVAEQTADFDCARYEPVSPPAMMLRERPVEGESLERLVVRSPSVIATDQATERHIIPPKVSQLMAEQHGKFDGPTRMRSEKAGYDLAGQEAGALNDGAVKIPASDPVAGQPAPSEVWVQPADQFPLKYLPDPASRGAVLLGLPGLLPEEIVEPGAKIVNKVPFDDPPVGDQWPTRLPFRIRLVPIERGVLPAEPKWTADRVLIVELPKAEKRVVRLSSYLSAEDLERQGVWQWIKSRAPAKLAEVQSDTLAGRSWATLPWRELTLIHPVLQPLDPPSVAIPSPAQKKLDETTAVISGDVTSEAASTGKVDLRAHWTDPLDDPAQPAPTTLVQRSHLCEVFVEEGANVTPVLDSVTQKKPVHHFGDTKFHSVTYTPIATTRFREYFPTALTSDPAKVTSEGAPSDPVVILNSARPDAPKVLYVVPTFGWKEETPASDTTTRTRKGGGLRVYLDRPWYSSGDGELLGVVFKEDAVFTGLADDLKAIVTQWGADPIWLSFPTASAARKKHFKGAVDKADVTPAEVSETVAVVGYEVEYDPVRRLWFADIELDLGASYTPFVRLALVRFQPNSVAGAHISRVIRAEFAQLAADRIASVTTTPDGAGAKFKIVVKGATYTDSSAMRVAPHIGKDGGKTGHAEIEVLFQKRHPKLGADPDLAWQTLSTTLLTQPAASPGTWQGDVALADPLLPNTYRLLLREYEWHRTDYQKEGMLQGGTIARRIVYADAISLG